MAQTNYISEGTCKFAVNASVLLSVADIHQGGLDTCLARLVRYCYLVASGSFVIDVDLGDHTLRSDVDVLVSVTSQLYLKAIVRALRHLDEVDIVNACIWILLLERLHDDVGDVSLSYVPARGEPLTRLCEEYLLFFFVVPYLYIDHAVIVVHI